MKYPSTARVSWGLPGGPTMRSLALAVLLAATPALAGDTSAEGKKGPSRHYNILPQGDTQGRGCELQVGPNDRVAQQGDVVVQRGEVVEAAFALNGAVRIEAGGTVGSALAVGGSVTAEGTVKEGAVAIRGDVVVRNGGRVGSDAVAIAGRVRVESGGLIRGDVTSIGPGFLVGDLAEVAMKELARRGPCVVKVDPKAGGSGR